MTFSDDANVAVVAAAQQGYVTMWSICKLPLQQRTTASNSNHQQEYHNTRTRRTMVHLHGALARTREPKTRIRTARTRAPRMTRVRAGVRVRVRAISRTTGKGLAWPCGQGQGQKGTWPREQPRQGSQGQTRRVRARVTMRATRRRRSPRPCMALLTRVRRTRA